VAARSGVCVGRGVGDGLGVLVGTAVLVAVGSGVLVDVGCVTPQASEIRISAEMNEKMESKFFCCISPP
jgi:hypothetical protein